MTMRLVIRRVQPVYLLVYIVLSTVPDPFIAFFPSIIILRRLAAGFLLNRLIPKSAQRKYTFENFSTVAWAFLA